MSDEGPPAGSGDAERAAGRRLVHAIRFKQWLELWNQYDFDQSAHRRKPDPYLYTFSMPASELRILCDVFRRKRDVAGADGIQRRRDESRTGRIRRYVRTGYPFGDLRRGQQTPDMLSLRKPGWLPTAIVVNILTADDVRRKKKVEPDQLVKPIENADGSIVLSFPSLADPTDMPLAPMEVIDGQHRLWAFDDSETDDPIPDDFELPVVAFYGLDIAWQAYLFWSINVSPKKINPSHAFDLYPLLRTQDWLDRVGELTVYREARAQELVEVMYSHSTSPWKARINMLGEKGGGGVSQAAWVRALTTSFLSTGKGKGRSGLFQSPLPDGLDEPLGWTRAQQAAFLIGVWKDIREALSRFRHQHFWIRQYDSDDQRAFVDKTSLLNQDMGVRACLAVVNDVFFASSVEWKLRDWLDAATEDPDTAEANVSDALSSIDGTPFRDHMRSLADGLVRFDWRSLEGMRPDDSPELVVTKRSYRGSGGYSALRDDILKEVEQSGNDDVADTARSLLTAV